MSDFSDSTKSHTFSSSSEDMEAENEDLFLHRDVRWLSKGKVLDHFYSLLPHIQEYVKEKRQKFPELSSATWLLDIAF